MAGISSVLAEQAPPPRVIGLQVAASSFMHGLFYHNTQADVEDLPTLADGLAGAVEKGSVTIPIIKKNVGEIMLFSEDEIAHAVAFAWTEYGEKIEGSAAVGLAAILSEKVTARPAVIVITGGNIQPEIHAEICKRDEN